MATHTMAMTAKLTAYDVTRRRASPDRGEVPVVAARQHGPEIESTQKGQCNRETRRR